ncbi:putative iron-regulated membrane protein [Amycolatopsis bartoniae]|uniref:Uncharacterized protein n=1 Tax=Amycolatopsis bartoniae TaxID=941986 RepID=A0A8H9IPA3_9PSEU|nr:hypothetical protein [Amycolatopsis bartoniae]MBB2938007.1 putative iron-regulated membrane protein [Amycolatopsis bartoniae]TVT07577.1 hypothetical protein FNH07_15525 [Amycolatopsis bartoniae]GHF42278.1 hypothetical protein GCM10017566_14840 [Amycolatopsis bartoniae]
MPIGEREAPRTGTTPAAGWAALRSPLLRLHAGESIGELRSALDWTTPSVPATTTAPAGATGLVNPLVLAALGLVCLVLWGYRMWWRRAPGPRRLHREEAA